jgi:hypothetical protein
VDALTRAPQVLGHTKATSKERHDCGRQKLGSWLITFSDMAFAVIGGNTKSMDFFVAVTKGVSMVLKMALLP